MKSTIAASDPVSATAEFAGLWDDWKRSPGEPQKEALLLAYLPLIQRVYARLRIGLAGVDSRAVGEDLKSSGVLGLMEAFRHFDEGQGTSFSTYATHRIRGAMLDELRRQDWLSKGCRRRFKEIQKAYATVQQKLGRNAGEAEVAVELGLTVERLREELIAIGPATLVFLDGLGPGDGEGGAGRLADPKALNPEDESARLELVQKLARLIPRLPENERRVLTLFVYERLGQKEIAASLGVTPSRVSQIYAQAVLRLQAGLTG
jgi:RNA polymerase sigma factor for flagellar operon FliA